MFATASGVNNASCQNCDTTTTPLWRKAEDGTNLCNACGLFLKLHGRSRPIALKSNIIRSRNRVKTPQNGTKRKTPYDAPATPGEIARQQQHQQSQQAQHSHQAPSPSPYEPHPRSLMTPSQHDDTHAQFTENVFDPQLSHPSNQVSNAANPFGDTPQSVGADQQTRSLVNEQDQDLESINSALRARVNELEIINDLFRSRITELESKQQPSQAESTQLPSGGVEEEALKAQVAALESELRALKRSPPKEEAKEDEVRSLEAYQAAE